MTGEMKNKSQSITCNWQSRINTHWTIYWEVADDHIAYGPKVLDIRAFFTLMAEKKLSFVDHSY